MDHGHGSVTTGRPGSMGPVAPNRVFKGKTLQDAWVAIARFKTLKPASCSRKERYPYQRNCVLRNSRHYRQQSAGKQGKGIQSNGSRTLFDQTGKQGRSCSNDAIFERTNQAVVFDDHQPTLAFVKELTQLKTVQLFQADANQVAPKGSDVLVKVLSALHTAWWWNWPWTNSRSYAYKLPQKFVALHFLNLFTSEKLLKTNFLGAVDSLEFTAQNC